MFDGDTITRFLGFFALVLSIINGLILVTQWRTNRPFLRASPIHPDIYQWWFRLPDRENDKGMVRTFGFLCYVGIANSGGQATSLIKYRLRIRNRLPLRQLKHKFPELRPTNIPQPEFHIGEDVKYVSVLGQQTLKFDGLTFVQSGQSISGMACYYWSVYGDERWNPRTNNDNTIDAKFIIDSVNGKARGCKIRFHEASFDRIREILPGIDVFAGVEEITSD